MFFKFVIYLNNQCINHQWYCCQVYQGVARSVYFGLLLTFIERIGRRKISIECLWEDQSMLSIVYDRFFSISPMTEEFLIRLFVWFLLFIFNCDIFFASMNQINILKIPMKNNHKMILKWLEQRRMIQKRKRKKWNRIKYWPDILRIMKCSILFVFSIHKILINNIPIFIL